MTFILFEAISGLVYSMYNYLIPLDMATVYGDQGSVLYGTMSTVNCITVLLLTPLVTRLFKKLCETKKLLVGEILFIVGYIIFVTLVKLPAFCYVSIVVFTIGEVFSTIAGMPFLTKRIPSSHRGRIIAINSVFYTFVYSGLNVAVGSIYDQCGSLYAWITIFAFSALAIILLFFLIKLDRKYYRNLYYSVEVKGHTISIKTTNLPLLEEYYKGFVYDSCLFAKGQEIPVYEYSKEKVGEYFAKITSRENQKNYLILDGGNPIGESHLKNIDMEKKTAELSIHLQNDKVKNKGYGTVGEQLTLKRAFIELGLEKVTASVLVDNKRSQRVLEKVGFTKVNEDQNYIYYEIKKADR